MKVKNIMFSGFAAAILMGVGAANAVVANPVTLADQGYVDAKINLLAGQKVSEITEENRDNADLYTSVKAVTGYVKEITTGEMGQLGDLAVLNSIKDENVADDAAIAQSKIAGLVDALADKAVKSEVTEALNAKADKSVVDGLLTGDDSVANQIANALKDAEGNAKYETAGAAAAAEAAAKAYADGLASNYDAAGAAAAAEAAAKAYADGLASNYDAEGAAAQALTDAKAYTDAEIDKVEVNVTANTNAITTLNGDGDGSVKKMAATAAEEAVANSGHATQEALQAEIDRAKAAEKVNADAIDALETGKLDVVESAGTYMVSRDAEGNVSYTKVRVATGVDGAGNATVTE